MRRGTTVALGAPLVLTAIVVGSLSLRGRAAGVSANDANAMAVDADASTSGVVDASATHAAGEQFDVSIDITAAATPWAAWRASLQYDPSLLEFVPTSDLTGDMVDESWTYTGLGETALDTPVAPLDSDGDTVDDSLFGTTARISGTTQATGQAAVVTFRCLAGGLSPLHLVTVPEDPTHATTTVDEPGAEISTGLTDASVTCSAGTATPTSTPGPVGGTAQLPHPEPYAAAGEADSPALSSIVLAAAASAGALLLAGGVWCARKRRRT